LLAVITVPLSLSCYAFHRYLHSFPTRRSSDLRFLSKRVLAIGTWLPDVGMLDAVLDRSIAEESRVYVVVGRHDASGYEGSLWLRSEEHTSELQSRVDLVCRLLLEKKKCRLTNV